MAIESVSMFNVGQVNAPLATNKLSPSQAQENFGDFLQSAINSVNDTQKASDVATNKLISGGNIELHEVMIASQKASIALNATLEVRNKVVEAYQEIMRMQV
ncbi:MULTISPECIES: flagellar hook-basal body complex protein FliE [unclassified Psychrobacillus]|uniref:flagellar hook-basal body complex protein FliE n=1 Tax=unclassified Psychrobacillus TaxID=2636677 RepID=UPI00146CA136|nr:MULTISPECIES: flagellar hook-basal body complex protein FliE [unclassified Psychrobacillus]MCM3356936.1 flagellar hook-basal body complex protein FliE [Psychrobacillus sp. MER TA 171]NME04833.1 flagellar hook-basal body complex protein FliE [Psychrobacillus sp. BL-248-WT-3]